MIKENPHTTIPIISETLAVSPRTIERDLSQMQKMGVIRREGNRNSGIWVILEQFDKEV